MQIDDACGNVLHPHINPAKALRAMTGLII